ncbi:MAG: radical SAM family heme chaperone HemW [Anaerolineae bacterium]
MGTLAPSPSAGLYIHLPFCLSKCAYCDFTSYVGAEDLVVPYLDAVKHELDLRLDAWRDVEFDTLYLGGGTPTCLPVENLADLVLAVLGHLPFGGMKEVTVEANPGTVDERYVAALLAAGVNRLSIGVQSWHPDELASLGRRHSPDDVTAAVQAARRAGCTNLSLDLMLGLPGQTIASWDTTLQAVLALQPEHLSLYTLTLEDGTPLARAVGAGVTQLPDDALCAEMYADARDKLAQAGFTQYELSNWALGDTKKTGQMRYPRFASRHNLHYWHNERYLGLGAAAFSYDGRSRWGNTRLLAEYIGAVQADSLPVAEDEVLPADQALGETIMLGLRLVDGVRWAELQERNGLDARGRFAAQIEDLAAQGLLQVDESGMRLTPRALYVANRVLREFV